MRYLKPDTSSPALNAAIEKIEKTKGVPRVNLPALARRDEPFMECWEASPGHVFVSSDFVSLEPSISAHFSKDEYYRYATFEGIGKEPYIDAEGRLRIDDVYLMTASVMPKIKYEVIDYFTKPENCKLWLTDKEQCKQDLAEPRKRAKPACLGFNYGMGPKRFTSQCHDAGIEITQSEASAMYKAYWQLFSGLKGFIAQINSYMEKYKSLENIFGYRLTTEPHKSYNAYIQSSASGVLDLFNLHFFKSCPEAQFVAIIHDEVIYEIPENLIDYAKEKQKQAVEELNKSLKFDIPMRLDFTVAKTFAEMK